MPLDRESPYFLKIRGSLRDQDVGEQEYRGEEERDRDRQKRGGHERRLLCVAKVGLWATPNVGAVRRTALAAKRRPDAVCPRRATC